MTEKRLVIKLDQYAGNVDEITCVALLGFGEDRYGDKQARELYEEKVLPIISKDPEYDPEYGDFPLDTVSFNTEYGSMSYELDTDANALRIGLDRYCTLEDIHNAISIWKQAYGNDAGEIEINVLFEDKYNSGKDETVTVKVLGFDLIEIKEFRTELM